MLQKTSSHEAIQEILQGISENELARRTLQHLLTEIYTIVKDDTTPYKCRIYIQDLAFSYCIGTGGHELVINVMEHGAEYQWLYNKRGWFSWFPFSTRN